MPVAVEFRVKYSDSGWWVEYKDKFSWLNSGNNPCPTVEDACDAVISQMISRRIQPPLDMVVAVHNDEYTVTYRKDTTTGKWSEIIE